MLSEVKVPKGTARLVPSGYHVPCIQAGGLTALSIIVVPQPRTVPPLPLPDPDPLVASSQAASVSETINAPANSQQFRSLFIGWGIYFFQGGVQFEAPGGWKRRNRAKGGSDHINNYQLLCGFRNRTKGTGSQAELLAKLKRDGPRGR